MRARQKFVPQECTQGPAAPLKLDIDLESDCCQFMNKLIAQRKIAIDAWTGLPKYLEQLLKPFAKPMLVKARPQRWNT